MEIKNSRSEGLRADISIAGLRASLHEFYIRASIHNPAEETQILIAVQILKETATELLDLVRALGMSGENIAGYPAYFFVKPISALISTCKVYSYTKTPDDGWLLDYATKVDQVMAEKAERGSALSRNLAGKALGVMRWWASKPEIRMDDAPFQVLQETVVHGSDASTPWTDFDFQMFLWDW